MRIYQTYSKSCSFTEIDLATCHCERCSIPGNKREKRTGKAKKTNHLLAYFKIDTTIQCGRLRRRRNGPILGTWPKVWWFRAERDGPHRQKIDYQLRQLLLAMWSVEPHQILENELMFNLESAKFGWIHPPILDKRIRMNNQNLDFVERRSCRISVCFIISKNVACAPYTPNVYKPINV